MRLLQEPVTRRQGASRVAPPRDASITAPHAIPVARRARGHLPWRRVVVLIAVVLVAVLLVSAVLIWQRAARFNDAVSSRPALSSALWGPLGGSDRVNVLLLGYADATRSGAFLSDSINVLSIDPKSGTTTEITIPRDLWVEGNPSLPGNGKINEAFAVGHADGGFEEAGARAEQVVSDVTGLKLSGWLAVDFEGFKAIVDAVGGVTVNNPTAFHYPRTNPERDGAKEWTGYFPKGNVTLSGDDALFYVRARYTDVPAEASDFARSTRQARVLAAVRDKLGSAGLGTLGTGLSLMSALEGRFQTNLSVIDLYLLADHLAPDARLELKEDEILQATRNSAGQYILVVIGRASPADYEPLRAFISSHLSTEKGS